MNTLNLTLQTAAIACTVTGEGAVIGDALVNPPGSVGVIRWENNDKSQVGWDILIDLFCMWEGLFAPSITLGTSILKR